jgi:hypothetical protein
MMANTKLPLRTWFSTMSLISQAKTGLSALAFMRDLGVNYSTAWLAHHKIMGAMSRADAADSVGGRVQVADACLSGEHPGKTGRGSPNKVPLMAAIALSPEGRSLRVKMSPVPGFTLKAVADTGPGRT